MVLQPSKLFDKCILTNFSKNPSSKNQPDFLVKESSTDGDRDIHPVSVPVPVPVPVITDIITAPVPVIQDTNVIPDTKVIPDPVSNALMEFDLNLDDVPETETVQLRNRKEVYYTMYREAKKKAKIAKDLALSSYLEARRIKNTYMLDELSDDSDENDSDDDNDSTDELDESDPPPVDENDNDNDNENDDDKTDSAF
jgi:hypothetical protein